LLKLDISSNGIASASGLQPIFQHFSKCNCKNKPSELRIAKNKLSLEACSIQLLSRGLKTNSNFSIYADASAVSDKQDTSETEERFQEAAITELLPLLEGSVSMSEDAASLSLNSEHKPKLHTFLYGEEPQLSKLFDFDISRLAPQNKFLDHVLVNKELDKERIQSRISKLRQADAEEKMGCLEQHLKLTDGKCALGIFELELDLDELEAWDSDNQFKTMATEDIEKRLEKVGSKTVAETVKAMLEEERKKWEIERTKGRKKYLRKSQEWKTQLERHHFEELEQANTYFEDLWVDVKQHLFGLRYEVFRLQGDASYKLDFMEIFTLMAAQIGDLVSDVLFYIGTVNGVAFRSAGTFETVQPAALFFLIFSACFFVAATSYLLSVRCRAAKEKLTQAETAIFRKRLMWVQFRLACAQILSEDVPQTVINFHISHATHKITTTAILSGLISLVAAGGILLEVTRRIRAANANAVRIAKDRHVAEFVASGTHAAGRHEQLPVDSDIFSCSNLQGIFYCYSYFWLWLQKKKSVRQDEEDEAKKKSVRQDEEDEAELVETEEQKIVPTPRHSTVNPLVADKAGAANQRKQEEVEEQAQQEADEQTKNEAEKEALKIRAAAELAKRWNPGQGSTKSTI
jgi:hypothetical protein